MTVDRNLLRKDYNELNQSFKRDRTFSGAQGQSVIQECLNKANQLHGFVEKPREHATDAGLFESMAEAHAELARKIAANQQGRTINDLVAVLHETYVGGDDPLTTGQDDPYAFRWSDLNADVSKMFRAAPGVNCMLGPLDAQPKVHKPRQQRQKRQVAEVSRPEELENIVENEKQETDRNVEEMWKVLTKGESPVAELVCNPQSFTQTVENMFTLAFLVRDGKVQLLHDPEVGMVARKGLTKQEKQQLQQQAGGSRAQKPVEEQQQFVVALTKENWEEMRAIVRAEDCKMRHREHDDLDTQAAPASQAAHASQAPPASQAVPGSRSQRGNSGSGRPGLVAVKEEAVENSKRRRVSKQ